MTFVDWDDMPKWGLINKALELPFPEPVETYSSSKHLYTDLDIPEGTKGTLPRSARVRAGLDAEEVEDLGETGRRKPAGRDAGRSGGRDGGRSGGRDARSGLRARLPRARAPVADDAPVLPKRTSSTRRRTRGSGAALEAVAGERDLLGGAGERPGRRSGDAGEAGAPRARRRRGGRGRGKGAGEGGEPAPAAE